MRNLITIISLLLSACSGGCGGGSGSGNPTTQPAAAPSTAIAIQGITKSHALRDGTETALIVFNGEPLSITFVRGVFDPHGNSIEIRRLSTNEVLANKPWAGGMGTAIVSNGVIHIFGSTSWASGGGSLIHSTLDADFTPSTPVVILTVAPNVKLYNSDITATPTGFVLAYENNSHDTRFIASSDLTNWSSIGGSFASDRYNGCPTIDYVNGWYYLTYLSPDGSRYVTNAARSADLTSFQYANKALLVPSAGEGSNNSDVDMVEFNGQVLFVYLDGDQLTYAKIHTATFQGNLSQLFAELFN